MKLRVRQRALISRFSFPDDRALVTTRAFEVTVETVVRCVEFAVEEPLCVRWFPLADGLPRREPAQLRRFARPVGFGIGRSGRIDRRVVEERRFRELSRRREAAVFGEESIDVVGHYLQ